MECQNTGSNDRIGVSTVVHLERVLGGDPMTEEMVLRFIGVRWGAKNLFYLPPKVAAEAARRPADFIRAAKECCGMGVGF